MTSEPGRRAGKVYLVGAGPGHPGLITLRGVECLRRADVVLYDYLASPALLAHAPQARHICLGQHGRSRIWKQQEVNDKLVSLAQQGFNVVRLKGGDPAVFARGGEEAEYLQSHGIAYEMVPGVTAAVAASSYAGIPITHRDHASAVALITGQEKHERSTQGLDYRQFASFPGTLVVYMGVTTASTWVEQLIAGGKDPQTPAAIVRRCSLPDQKTIVCTLAEVPERLANIRPPAVVIIGRVVELVPTLSWFERRPLFGQRILVTRPADQAEALVEPLTELGAEVLVEPAIEIAPPETWNEVDQCLAQLDRWEWVVFSSANGVRYFLERLWETGRDGRALGRSKLAVIGPGTGAELARYHLQADLEPESYVAEALADALAAHAQGKRVLLVRASRGREVLAERLRAVAAEVHQVVAYRSHDVETANPEILQAMADEQIHWVTVTSSAIARSLARLYGDRLHRSKLVSISPITTQTLNELGFPPAAEAEIQTMPGVVDAILRAQPS